MFLENIVYYAFALMVGISVHEAAHAWTAYKLGDYTAKYAGRVTLNPLAHLDPLGTLMIFIVHFGWGKPVPYNPYHLNNPKRDAALIAVAGPTANFLTALVLAVPLKYLPWTAIPMAGFFLQNVLEVTVFLNIMLMVFNLLPIAPLDGSKLIGILIPHEYEAEYQEFLRVGPFILIGVILLENILNFHLLSSILTPLFKLVYTFIFLVT